MSAGGLRVFFAGGGTGGHLYPGLAIARAMVAIDADTEPYFIGARRGVEKDILPDTGFPFALLDLHPLYRTAPWNNWRTLLGGAGAWRALTRLAAGQPPRVVVGTGGYAAGVALAWARVHGIPTVLHESNSHPGLTTRVFSGGAMAVYLAFPEAVARVRGSRTTEVRALGCPIDPPPRPAPSRELAKRAWDLPADAFVVLVTGGSQGARSINEAMADWCRRGLPGGVAVIWGTGRAHAAAYVDHESQLVRVRPYLAPIAEAYAAADLAVTRAGAMTIAELCAWGVPSILVPLPTAAQDHQTFNAKAVSASGAAVHLPQDDLSAESLDATVRELLARRDQLDRMRAAALSRAEPESASRIAGAILAHVRAS